jgi:hypothetical protein
MRTRSSGGMNCGPSPTIVALLLTGAIIVADRARSERRLILPAGFPHTAVTTAGQVTSYLVAHSAELRPHPFTQQPITAALVEHSGPPGAAPPGAALLDPLTPAEQRVTGRRRRPARVRC